MNGNNVKYFDSFVVEYIPKKTVIGNTNSTTIICRIQVNDSIICWYFCIGFVNFVLTDKSVLDYTKVWWNNTEIFSIKKWQWINIYWIVTVIYEKCDYSN